ncbi:MAG: hypothetical protein OXH46_00750 [Gemmatimonadetes bacterium]|nr:hypothetical protein [Gemmatimonadota bacterium]
MHGLDTMIGAIRIPNLIVAMRIEIGAMIMRRIAVDIVLSHVGLR